jgi:hypothetical protein
VTNTLQPALETVAEALAAVAEARKGPRGPYLSAVLAYSDAVDDLCDEADVIRRGILSATTRREIDDLVQAVDAERYDVLHAAWRDSGCRFQVSFRRRS